MNGLSTDPIRALARERDTLRAELVAERAETLKWAAEAGALHRQLGEVSAELVRVRGAASIEWPAYDDGDGA